MPAIGGMEMVVILIVVLIVFGAGRLPDVMRDLGRGMREMRDIDKDLKR